MAHFLDRLVTEMRDLPKGLLFQEFIDMLPRAEMFIANNVFDYFDKADKFKWGEAGRSLTLSDLPNVAPPFQTYFVAGSPMVLGDEGGTLFHARPIMESQHPAFSIILEHNDIRSSCLELHRRGVRWVIYAVPFVRWYSTIYPPLVCCVMLIKEDGTIFFEQEGTHPVSIQYVIDQDLIPDLTERWKEGEWGEGFPEDADFTFFAGNLKGNDLRSAQLICKIATAALLPASLAVCFLHCRNVITIEHDPLINRQARRQSERRQQKTGYGLIKFRTLEIERFKKVLHEEGRVESNGLGVALHLCRGHFKDYREGPGLFGKHNGLWWWDSQARGDASIGTVLKDYKMPKVRV